MLSHEFYDSNSANAISRAGKPALPVPAHVFTAYCSFHLVSSRSISFRYFSPFTSVRLVSMAEAFGMQVGCFYYTVVLAARAIRAIRAIRAVRAVRALGGDSSDHFTRCAFVFRYESSSDHPCDILRPNASSSFTRVHERFRLSSCVLSARQSPLTCAFTLRDNHQVREVEGKVAALIMSNQISARIDSTRQTVHAKHTDQRSVSCRKVTM